MKTKVSKRIVYWIGVIVIGVSIGLALQFAKAWAEPVSVPTAGNVGAPINISKENQSKIGGIKNASAFFSAPKVCISGDCRTSWPTAANITCSCGTCWETKSTVQTSSSPRSDCTTSTGYWSICTPAGWQQITSSVEIGSSGDGCGSHSGGDATGVGGGPGRGGAGGGD